MCLNMVLQMHSMIACLRLKSDLGEGGGVNSKFVTPHKGGGGKIEMLRFVT